MPLMKEEHQNNKDREEWFMFDDWQSDHHMDCSKYVEELSATENLLPFVDMLVLFCSSR